MALTISVVSIFAIICVCLSEKTVYGKLGARRIVNFHTDKCDKKAAYPLTATDIQFYLTSDRSAVINGTLQSSVEIKTGIQAHIEVEHYLIFGWVRVPCLPIHLGSCTYPDICAWVPKKGTYEEDFSVEGKDTCRCPIHKGTCKMHLVPVALEISETGVNSLFSGLYRGSIVVKNNGRLLSCYNFNFTLVDNVFEKPAVLSTL